LTQASDIGYIYALMSAPVPRDPRVQLDPWRAVRSELGFEGEAFAEDLPRLAGALSSCGGVADWPARYVLRFGRDGDGRAVALGRAVLTIRPICQRCLGEVAILLDAPIAVGLVRDETQSEALPDHLDPVAVEEGRIRPLDLVEDELLLAIPQVPMHPWGACREAHRRAADPDADQGAEAPNRENPFAVLAGLKRQAPGREP
jgi:uncharacterized protein